MLILSFYFAKYFNVHKSLSIDDNEFPRSILFVHGCDFTSFPILLPLVAFSYIKKVGGG
jgi:hypothetical protein